MSKETRQYVWQKRHHLSELPLALPRVLQSAPNWSPKTLPNIYSLVQNWTPMSPVDAMELLLPAYPDTLVRSRAVEWISEMSDDDFFDFLPQLIQALKFESYHTSALARLLTEKSIRSPRIAHQTYWYV